MIRRPGPSLVFDHWSFTHRGSDRLALNDISAEVQAGERVAVMGAGGSGKSSLCFSAAGIIPHVVRGKYEGRVLVQGVEVAQATPAQLAGLVGLMLQDFEAQLVSSSVVLELAFGLESQNLDRPTMTARVRRYIGRTPLADYARANPGQLSGGLRQLLAISAVLVIEPGLVCLDEPTTDLDPHNRQLIQDLLAEARGRGTGVLVADHRSETALVADTVWLFKDGAVVRSGPPREVMTDADLLERCSVQPPGVVRFLRDLGCPAPVWTAEEAEAIIRQRWVVPESIALPSVGGPTKPGDALLEARGLTHTYPGSEEPAIRAVDLRIHEGEFVGLLGANGCGKTTLLKHFIRLLEPTAGEVRIAGTAAGSWSRAKLAEQVGYVFQNPDHQIFAATVEEEVAFALRQFGAGEKLCRERTAEALAAVGLAGSEKRDPFRLTRGERQRLAVASALATRPRVLLLDEPTKGIDYGYRSSLMALLTRLYREGHTVVMITHSVSLAAEYATRLVVMSAGKVCLDGPPRTVLVRGPSLEGLHIHVPELVHLSNRLGLESLLPGEMAHTVNGWSLRVGSESEVGR